MNDFAKDALNSDTAAQPHHTGETISVEDENTVRRQIEQNFDSVEIKTGNMQDAYRKAAAVYKTYQDNIRKAQTMKAEILIGAKNGNDLKDLLLKAAVCIGCLTGDSKVYAENMKQYLEKYQENE
jgi:hypothetical protein